MTSLDSGLASTATRRAKYWQRVLSETKTRESWSVTGSNAYPKPIATAWPQTITQTRLSAC